MTDQELIKALREDAPRIGWLGWGRPNDVGKKMADAADRLEALLADNAALGQEIDRQICKRSEVEREIGRLEVERDHFRDLTKKMWCEKRYDQWVSVDEQLPELLKLNDPDGDDWRESKRVFAVTADGECTVATFWRINEKFGWTDEVAQTEVAVKAWMTPEPPSTEGVE